MSWQLGSMWQETKNSSLSSRAQCQVLRQISLSRALPDALRRKMDRHQTEAVAEEAAFVTTIVREVEALLPISDKLLQEEWTDKYISGDSGVLLEVQSAILQRGCNTCRDLGTINAIMSHHAENVPVVSGGPATQMAQLEQETFDLKLKQLQYDLQCLRVAKAKRTTWESQVYHAKLEFRVARYQESAKHAKNFMDQCCKIIHYNKPETLIHSLQSFQRSTLEKHALDLNSSVHSCKGLFQSEGLGITDF